MLEAKRAAKLKLLIEAERTAAARMAQVIETTKVVIRETKHLCFGIHERTKRERVIPKPEVWDAAVAIVERYRSEVA